MAANQINAVNPLGPLTQARESVNAGAQNSTRLQSPNPAPAPATAQPTQSTIDPRLQNELLINEALRTLNFAPPNPVDAFSIQVTTPPVGGLGEPAELPPVLLNELVINQALQNLNFVSTEEPNALLINETPAQVEATDVLQDLGTIEQNELLLNLTLQNLNPTLEAITTTEEQLNTTAAAETAQGLAAAAAQQTGQTAAPAAAAATAATAATVVAAASVIGPATTATTVLPPTPIAATFLEQTITPTPVPFFVLNPDRTPYVLAVYETKNPTPGPGAPGPIPTEVQPTQPGGRARPVGRAALRRAWARQQVREYQEIMPVETRITPMEKDMRHVMGEVNADLSASGLPIHLVIAKSEEGYAVEVYDCSDNELCRISRDVPLKSEELTITLDNLEHETGILINTTS